MTPAPRSSYARVRTFDARDQHRHRRRRARLLAGRRRRHHHPLIRPARRAGTVRGSVPTAGLTGRDFLRVEDLSSEELVDVLDLADQLKQLQAERVPHELLPGRSLAMIFERSSTRTRVSFEVGMRQLGGSAVPLTASDTQIGRGESLGRHRPGAVAVRGRGRVPHVDARAHQGARRHRRRAGDQRALRPAPPLPGAGRRADAARAAGPAGRPPPRLAGRRAQQRVPLAGHRRRGAGDAGDGVLAARVRAGSGGDGMPPETG